VATILPIGVDRRTVEVYVQTEKLAPAKMHSFIVEQLNDLAVRGQLSPYDVSRSLRGDPDALAMVRADLMGDVSVDTTGRFTDRRIGAPGGTIAKEATTGT
jgi:hypothetical protein